MSKQEDTKNIQPHFDENIIVWDNKYSGKYLPPPKDYSQQFDLQWKLALEGDDRFYIDPGASVEDEYIDDRIYEWTGRHPANREFLKGSPTRTLDRPINPELIDGKKCIDIGCGMGRWTRVMQRLGAESVLSLDASSSAISSVSKFNDNFLQTNIMEIPEEHPELVEQFGFACFWGVAMCTHDPQKAFLSAASTVVPGGSLYLMVYCPEGIHNRAVTNIQRKRFYRLKDVNEKIEYVKHCASRDWDSEYPVSENIRNIVKKLLSKYNPKWKGSMIGYLDLLQPYYNWVIPKEAISEWMRKADFDDFNYLYNNPRSSYHILAKKRK